MSETIKVVCWVHGDDPKRRFFVRMKLSDDVMDMKKAICNEKKSFKELDYDALQLWKVSE
jgi:hypothetical protein